MKSLLFIPPDSLPPGIGRCFWLAHGLSRYFKVYYIQWIDSRNDYWLDSTFSKQLSFYRVLLSAKCFFRSILTGIRIKKQNAFDAPNLYYVFLPLMLKSSLSHFVGEINARKVSRAFNYWSFRRFLKKKKIDFIFHGENMMFSPILSDDIPAYYDMQDDFDEAGNSQGLLDYEKEFQRDFSSKCLRRFAINESTAKHMNEFYGPTFEVLPNGAYFKLFNSENEVKAKKIRTEMGLESCKLISYIGGRTHFDSSFAYKLAKSCQEKIPNAKLMFVGNLPLIECSNVVNVGLVSPENVHLYYLMSDVGLFLQDVAKDFNKNCHPLKAIQFSAARKPLIVPPLSSFSNETFENVFVEKYKVENWTKRILELEKFNWSTNMTRQWEGFSWEKITASLARMILNEQRS